MSQPSAPDDQRDYLLKKIDDHIRVCDTHVRELRRKNTRFIYVSLISSALGTVIAGLTAALGPLAGSGPGAWKVTCGAVAGLTACSTVAMGLHKQFTIPENLVKSSACLGKLHAMQLALTVTGRNPAEVVRDYETLVADYRDFLY